MALIFWLSSMPHIPGPELFSAQDKVGHFFVFGLFGIFVAGALGPWEKQPSWLSVGIVTIIVAVYGASDEVHQMFVPGRDASLADLFFDTLGGFSFAYLYRRLWIHFYHYISSP